MAATPQVITRAGGYSAGAGVSVWPRLIRRVLLLVAGLVLLVASLNFIVNPMGIYPLRVVPPVQWNTRAIKPALLAKADPKPEVLILGSSRSMQIAPAQVRELTGMPAFNAGVDSAMAEDDYVMLRYAVERAGVVPRLALIGIDVEAFHNALPVDDRLLETDAFAGMLPVQGLSARKKFTKLFSSQQTHLMVRSLRIQLTGTAPVHNYYDLDGFLHYGDYEREIASGRYDVERHVRRDAQDYVERIRGFTRISEQRRKYLEDLLQYSRDHGIKVALFITPLGPRVAAAVRAHGYEQRRVEVLGMLTELGARYGATVYDLSSVEKFGGDPNGFWDGAHMTARNNSLVTRLILQRIRDDRLLQFSAGALAQPAQ